MKDNVFVDLSGWTQEELLRRDREIKRGLEMSIEESESEENKEFFRWLLVKGYENPKQDNK